jgi:hypothetical protein
MLCESYVHPRFFPDTELETLRTHRFAGAERFRSRRVRQGFTATTSAPSAKTAVNAVPSPPTTTGTPVLPAI